MHQRVYGNFPNRDVYLSNFHPPMIDKEDTAVKASVRGERVSSGVGLVALNHSNDVVQVDA